MKATQKKTILKAFQDTEKLLKPSLKELFTDVYDKPSWNLVRYRHPLVFLEFSQCF